MAAGSQAGLYPPEGMEQHAFFLSRARHGGPWNGCSMGWSIAYNKACHATLDAAPGCFFPGDASKSTSRRAAVDTVAVSDDSGERQ